MGVYQIKMQQKQKPIKYVKSNRVQTIKGQRLYRLMMEQRRAVSDQLHPPELNQQNVFCRGSRTQTNRSTQRTSCTFAGSNSGNGFSSNADEIAVATKDFTDINPMRELS
jgi:hypothetical protein